MNCLLWAYFTGSMKVWDFGAGQLLKAKNPPATSVDDDLSVTGIVYNKVGDDYFIITSGWNNSVRMYLVSCPVLWIQFDTSMLEKKKQKRVPEFRKLDASHLRERTRI